MADIFLSYASEDRNRVQPLVEALESAAYTVWWDRRLDPGISFDREIEQQLSAASCVMVVWSKTSVDSDWVREEADDGLKRGILIPVQIDDCQLPLGFRRTQAAQLIGWPGTKKDLSLLIKRVSNLIGKQAEPSPDTPRSRWRIGAACVGLLLTVTVVVGYFYREPLMLGLVLHAPSLFFGDPIEQELGFTMASDGTRIAYATSGSGPPIVQVAGFGTHLIDNALYDGEGLLALSSREHLFVRYDGRGFGLSDREVHDYSLRARVSDLQAVVDALGLETFGVLATSAGGQTAIAYAAQHPDRVTRLVIAGGFTSWRSMDDVDRPVFERIVDLFEVASDRPEIFAMQADLFLHPDGDETGRRFLGEMLRRAGDGRAIADFARAAFEIDVSEDAKRLDVPTLVMLARDDAIVSLDAGRTLATLIPGAQLEIVEGGHIVGTASTPTTRRRVLEFLSYGP